MFLVDTDVLSEARKGARANVGVRAFFADAIAEDGLVYVSVVAIGELRRGVEKVRHRGDAVQAQALEGWLDAECREYAESILTFNDEVAHVWGRLRVPNPENPLDKQIAATALIHDLTVVTRNTDHFAATGVRLLNPFHPQVGANG